VALPGGRCVTRAEQWTRDILLRVWWVVFPIFALLVSRFSYERACRNPYELLETVMHRQAAAVSIAAIYVGAHVWMVAACLITARAWDTLGSPGAELHRIWGDARLKLLAMAVALTVEQVPRAVWAWLYSQCGVC